MDAEWVTVPRADLELVLDKLYANRDLMAAQDRVAVEASVLRLRSAMQHPSQPLGGTKTCGVTGCGREIAFFSRAGFGRQGEWVHRNGQPLGEVPAHLPQPKVHVS